MKKYFPILLILIFVFGALISDAAADDIENPLVDYTASKIMETNESASLSVNQSVSLNETLPGDNKDNYNSTSLNRSAGEEISKYPGEAQSANNSTNNSTNKSANKSTNESGEVKAEEGNSLSSFGLGILVAAIGLLGVYAAMRK